MAYNKHVWTLGETITSALLNNIEDEVDAIADLTYTFAGFKTFAELIKVRKTLLPQVQLEESSNAKNLALRNNNNALEIYDVQATAMKMTDIITHGHTGGVDGVVHGPTSHTDRLHTKFLSGGSFISDYQSVVLTSYALSGPEMRYTNDDPAFRNFRLPPSELYKHSSGRTAYLHMASISASTGDIVMVVNIQGFNTPDSGTAGVTVFLQSGIVIAMSSGYRYVRTTLNNIDLSTQYDLYSALVYRDSGNGSDTLDASVVLMGLEIVPESDQ